MNELNLLTEAIIGMAIEVHRQLGPGLLESIYESALCIELEQARMAFRRQHSIPIAYKGRTIGDLRPDLVVDDKVVLEIKSVDRFDPIFEAQVLTYLKVTQRKLGLLINFNQRLLVDGIKRYIL